MLGGQAKMLVLLCRALGLFLSSNAAAEDLQGAKICQTVSRASVVSVAVFSKVHECQVAPVRQPMALNYTERQHLSLRSWCKRGHMHFWSLTTLF